MYLAYCAEEIAAFLAPSLMPEDGLCAAASVPVADMSALTPLSQHHVFAPSHTHVLVSLTFTNDLQSTAESELAIADFYTKGTMGYTGQSLQEFRIAGLPPDFYYIPNFISIEEESSILQKA